jgi:hypothetical protein
MLAAAWEYKGRHYMGFFPDFARLRQLARAAGSFALVEAPRNKVAAVRAARAAIGAGYRIMGNWPVKDAPDPANGETITVMVGVAVAAIGYVTLVQVYEAAGDEPGRRRTQEEYDAFRERRDAWRKVVTENLATQDTGYYY